MEKEWFNEFLNDVFSATNRSKIIYLPKIGVCVKVDKIDKCSDDLGDTWRKRTPEEHEYITSFFSNTVNIYGK